MNPSAGTANNAIVRNAANKKHPLLRKFASSIKLFKKLSVGRHGTTGGDAAEAFRRRFDAREGEELIRACECRLWTTAGPICGFLFISSDKMAFCSHKSLKLASLSAPTRGEDRRTLRFHYKVVIPLNKIMTTSRNRCQENTNKDGSPSQDRYLHVVTKDQFEFWFLESSPC